MQSPYCSEVVGLNHCFDVLAISQHGRNSGQYAVTDLLTGNTITTIGCVMARRYQFSYSYLFRPAALVNVCLCAHTTRSQRYAFVHIFQHRQSEHELR